MKNIIQQQISYLVYSVIIFMTISCSPTTEKYTWETTRGFNVAVDVGEEDIKDLAALGANHIRLSFPVMPFMQVEKPYDFNEAAFENLDRVLDICEKYNLKVIIDPHRFPGTSHKWTMLGSDEFWKDYQWHEKAIALWERIAQQCSNRGDVIGGYALLNEPSLPIDRPDDTPADLNKLYVKLVDAVRKYDKKHTIIISAPRLGSTEGDRDYVEGLSYLTPIDDENLCYEIHMYKPQSFTHQGVWEESEFIEYPGYIDGEEWDIGRIRKHFEPVAEFAQKHNVPIYIGEFSCPRWTGNSGNTYIKDVITVAVENNFSWAYHAFRENQLWDIEMDNFNRNDTIRKPTTPRKELLVDAFKKNPAK